MLNGVSTAICVVYVNIYFCMLTTDQGTTCLRFQAGLHTSSVNILS